MDGDELLRRLYEVAGDALSFHPLVRWVTELNGVRTVVTRDGRQFELSLREVQPNPPGPPTTEG